MKLIHGAGPRDGLVKNQAPAVNVGNNDAMPAPGACVYTGVEKALCSFVDVANAGQLAAGVDSSQNNQFLANGHIGKAGQNKTTMPACHIFSTRRRLRTSRSSCQLRRANPPAG